MKHFTEAPDFRIDFLGIGAPKAGTTWLSMVLGEHPDIFTPPGKEIEYFNAYRTEYDLPNRNANQPLLWYHQHFRNARPDQLKGEINPVYLLEETDPARIYAYNPALKLIAILRDPVARACSQYQFNSKWIPQTADSFAAAVQSQPALLAHGMYAHLLGRYLTLFPREQLLVLFHEDLKRNPLSVYRQVTQFLGVQDFDPPGLHARPNETRMPRSKVLNALLANSRKWMFRLRMENLRPALDRIGLLRLAGWIRDTANAGDTPPPISLSPELERELRNHFSQDIALLEKITTRDLSHWKPSS